MIGKGSKEVFFVFSLSVDSFLKVWQKIAKKLYLLSMDYHKKQKTKQKQAKQSWFSFKESLTTQMILNMFILLLKIDILKAITVKIRETSVCKKMKIFHVLLNQVWKKRGQLPKLCP